MSALTKSTHTFATHDIPLECDVYQSDDYPKSSPVLLFFHSGGLVAGGRQDIPPWLVQVNSIFL
jgi:acetyl esterase/lipase